MPRDFNALGESSGQPFGVIPVLTAFIPTGVAISPPRAAASPLGNGVIRFKDWPTAARICVIPLEIGAVSAKGVTTPTRSHGPASLAYIIPPTSCITTVSAYTTHTVGGNTAISVCITPPGRGMTPQARGVTQITSGMMHAPGGMSQTLGGMCPTITVVMHEKHGVSPFPGGMMLVRSVVMHGEVGVMPDSACKAWTPGGMRPILSAQARTEGAVRAIPG